jgi:hypothetical protein
MAQHKKEPIRQSRVLASNASDTRFPSMTPDELPFVHADWTATEQARIAKLLAKEPAEPTPELMRALKAALR